ncbi:hypothetical protein [Kribbella qitaiheensis]|uniref:hypothetical protein n=1 Tax=Kribbella qitaiheensis TaxID=1544730 RepID=UPI001627306D|nr:hypothetical protein [Kribbella qitaiheensis]
MSVLESFALTDRVVREIEARGRRGLAVQADITVRAEVIARWSMRSRRRSAASTYW